MLEVFTIGGGEYIVNTFNAVAAWAGGGGYRSMLRVVMVMGLIYSLLVVAFNLDWRAWLNWFLQATAIYMCLMVPTVGIKVTDRLNPSLAPATIDNVPIGLGVIASFTSQVGDYLTRTAETVFVMPTSLNYTTNGMVYGARLFDATRNLRIRDAEFSTNLEEHFKACVFYDVMLGFKSMTDLANAPDLWAAIGPGSPARSQIWITRISGGGVESHIRTCSDAYAALDAQWTPMIEANLPIWGKELYPKLSNALAAQKLRDDVPVINQAFTGTAGGHVSILRQNTAINAFMQARNSMSGSTGAAAIDTFAMTRADIQARNTYGSIAQQAMSWVPILNVVLTVVFFAMFPVIFPLFLMPRTGVPTLKGYTAGFFYLAAWGPLYVVLHMIIMSRATGSATAMAPSGVTLSTFAGIGAVNEETATIAGFLLMSVPFLAAGMARGAMGIASHSMAMLAPAQNAAEAAALEQTTGNYSYGNVSYANSSANMRQSDQWSTAPNYMAGIPRLDYRADNGAIISSYGNGQEVIDTTGAISRLAFTPTMSTNSVAEMREVASEARRQAESYRNTASTLLTATDRDASVHTRSSETTSGVESASGSQSATSVDRFDRRTANTSEGIEQSNTDSDRFSVANNRGRQAIVQQSVEGQAGAGLGGRGRAGGGSGGPFSGSLGASTSARGTQQSDLSHSTNRNISSEDRSAASSSFRDDHASGSSASESAGTYERSGSFSRSSITDSSARISEESLALAQSYQRSAEKLDEIAQSLSRDASYAESHGLNLSENLSQDLAQWYRAEQARNPAINVPDLWATDLSAHDRATRSAMIERWMDDRLETIREEIRSEIQEPSLVSVQRPDVASESDVRGHYTPSGGGRRPSGPRGGNDPGAAAAIIDQGRKEIDEGRAAAQTGRAVNRQGGSRARSEVSDSQNVGFFNDPDLRK
ncbi:IncF plasmid conjugative transfer protein TraG [Sphingobium indicum BiD32]|uniref:IncF plasmid conjugative transfer protein TraG n=1 Tax=Sphingobium indicum BiD32 TaxID=1301087 RepID=N1MIX4_9SPHN|nr:conjugal transfer protein TraG N-terminal domain-containing protein [Sphingobium indicum]CCW16916.1 IncF plasmid conjugative transfer protein TraG [Sphingobium indicum BiD32]